jgi:hypothetical protein
MEAVLVLVGSGLVTAVIGKAKGSSFFLWFVIGAVLPVIGIIVVLAYRSEHREPERRCPRCGAVQKLYVQVCNVCGEDLYLPEDASEVRTPAMIEATRQARQDPAGHAEP